MKPNRLLCLALLLTASCAGPRTKEPGAPAAPATPAAVAAPAAPVAPSAPAPVAAAPKSGRPEIRYYEISEA
jgi:hypothetical protein